MSAIQINTDHEESYTMLPDLFIEQHMPHANGEFVKVYIYLLQLAQQKKRRFSLSETADVFACNERDITRAIRFWEERGLIAVDKSPADDTIAGIRFVSAPHGSNQQIDAGRTAAGNTSVPQAEQSQKARQTADVQNGSGIAPALSNDRTSMLMRDQKDVRQIVTIAEQYLGRTLSSTDLGRLLYLYDELHFSVDLIDYLIEYCVLKDKRSMHYIEKVGLEWYNDGVKTVSEARERTAFWSRDYFRILRAFGITNRNPVTREISYMKKWLTSFGFSMDLICEACERTITQTGRPRFDYADRILTAWYDAGVHTQEDVSALDQQHADRVTAEREARSNRQPQQKKPASGGSSSGNNNKFNNFTQRDYDYRSLEQQLLNQQSQQDQQ